MDGDRRQKFGIIKTRYANYKKDNPPDFEYFLKNIFGFQSTKKKGGGERKNKEYISVDGEKVTFINIDSEHFFLDGDKTKTKILRRQVKNFIDNKSKKSEIKSYIDKVTFGKSYVDSNGETVKFI